MLQFSDQYFETIFSAVLTEVKENMLIMYENIGNVSRGRIINLYTIGWM